MLTTVGSIATHISTAQWDNINNFINHFLDYETTHTDSKLTYHKIGMHILFHTDASYLTETKLISRARGYHYFSNKPKIPIKSDYPPSKHNHPVLVICKVIDSFMSPTQKSGTGGGYINSKEALPIYQTAIEMVHPQVPTPLQLDNKCEHGIITGVLQQKKSKDM